MSDDLNRCADCDVGLSTTDPSWWWCPVCHKKVCKDCYPKKHPCVNQPKTFPETVLRSEMDIQVAQARAEAYTKAAEIIRSGFDNGMAGIDGYHEALNIHLENLALQVESERDK